MLKVADPRIIHGTQGCTRQAGRRGFTLVELMMVVLILAIAAAMVVPMMSSGGGTKVLAAAQAVAADLEYAKSMAIARSRFYRVTFDSANERYQVEDQNGVVITHPVYLGSTYVVQLDAGRLAGVQITSAEFDGTHQIRFDHLGSPYNGDGTPLNSGVIQLEAGSFTQTIRIEPVTGLITID
jgi:prepilin-type N-terminal cleavage/methylation domain-containing protein